jgi:hypothetical protein
MVFRPSLPVRASIRLYPAFSVIVGTYTRKTFVRGSTGFLRRSPFGVPGFYFLLEFVNRPKVATVILCDSVTCPKIRLCVARYDFLIVNVYGVNATR